MSLNYQVSLHETPPVEAKVSTDHGILATAYQIMEDRNATLPAGRRVFRSTVRQIVGSEKSEPTAHRAVIDFFNTVENPNTHTPTRYTDLLPAGHPLAAPAPRAVTASFYMSDPRLPDDETRALVAAAVSAEPNSASRKYYVTRLEMRKVSQSVLSVINDADATVL